MDVDRYRQAERNLWESVGAQPTERHVKLDRTGTTVRLQEVGDGPPVVFVHGASNAGTSWASLAARLDDFRCILVDRPGLRTQPTVWPTTSPTWPGSARLPTPSSSTSSTPSTSPGRRRGHLVRGLLHAPRCGRAPRPDHEAGRARLDLRRTCRLDAAGHARSRRSRSSVD